MFGRGVQGGVTEKQLKGRTSPLLFCCRPPSLRSPIPPHSSSAAADVTPPQLSDTPASAHAAITATVSTYLSPRPSTLRRRCCRCRCVLLLSTPGTWVSMGVVSDGSYGITEGLVYSYPVTCAGGKWKVVQGTNERGWWRRRPGAASCGTLCRALLPHTPARPPAGGEKGRDLRGRG